MALILQLVWTTNSSASQEQYRATHYGVSYDGQRMGCGGTYRTWDVSIVAVGPADYNRYPCGTALQVTGPVGTIIVTRQDSCPGCRGLIDLSEAGITQVCGGLGSCIVTVERVEQ